MEISFNQGREERAVLARSIGVVKRFSPIEKPETCSISSVEI
jgi:hypothetical protein